MLILHLLPERQPALFFKKEKAQPLREKDTFPAGSSPQCTSEQARYPAVTQDEGLLRVVWRCREGQSQVTQEREKEEFPDQMKGEAGREGRELVTDEQGR